MLLSALSSASRAVSTKSTLPALEGLLINARGGLTLTGYNMETGISCSLEARVEEEGAAVFNTRLFFDIVKKLPEEIVSVEVDDKLTATIRSGFTEFKIPATPAEDFPELPTVERTRSFGVEAETLCKMIGRTLFAVSQNENKPVITGSLFEVAGDSLTVVSVDGFRLALCTQKIDEQQGKEDFSFVVPGVALREVERLAAENKGIIEIGLGKRHILFNMENTVIISRLLEGEFINYKNAVPQNQPICVKVRTEDLIDSVERVSIVVSEKLKNPIRCTFEENLLKLNCLAVAGSAYDECATEGSGGGLEIGFNNRFLLDALRAAPDEAVWLELNSSVSPCVIKPTGEERYLFMILPMRLRAGD